MKWLTSLLIFLVNAPLLAQGVPVQQGVDPSTFQSLQDRLTAAEQAVIAAQAAADNANGTASSASTTAANASSAASTAQSQISTLSGQVVKTINAIGPNAQGGVTLAIPDTSNLASSASVTSGLASEVAARNSAITSALVGYAKSLNGAAPDSSGNLALDLSPYATNTNLNAQIAATQAAGVQFVNGGVAQTVAQLQTNQPCSATYVGRYGKVTNLYGSVSTTMICETDTGSYYWRPTRQDYAVNNAATGGTLTLTPLISAPIQYLTGTLSSNMTITPSATNAWIGATFTVVSKGVLGLFGISLNGIVGGGTLSLLAGGMRQFTYTAAGWQGN